MVNWPEPHFATEAGGTRIGAHARLAVRRIDVRWNHLLPIPYTIWLKIKQKAMNVPLISYCDALKSKIASDAYGDEYVAFTGRFYFLNSHCEYMYKISEELVTVNREKSTIDSFKSLVVYVLHFVQNGRTTAPNFRWIRTESKNCVFRRNFLTHRERCRKFGNNHLLEMHWLRVPPPLKIFIPRNRILITNYVLITVILFGESSIPLNDCRRINLRRIVLLAHCFSVNWVFGEWLSTNEPCTRCECTCTLTVHVQN